MVNSIFKTYEVTVDTMKDSSVPQNMRYSQNDLKSAKILINVNHDGNEEDFSEAIAVRVSFEKSDKKIVYQDCQPINVLKGKYQVLLTSQTLTSVGIVTAHIHIYFPNDKKVETGPFTFEVVESKMSDEVIESTDSFTVIQKAIEVGEKFQNVDFNPIIEAGTKADTALTKSAENANQIGILSENVSNQTTQLVGKADKSYVDTKVSAVASGSPKGTYATLTALQTAKPTGDSNIYVVTADGKWYYWSGSAWTEGGVYQSTGLADSTVSTTKILDEAATIAKRTQLGGLGIYIYSATTTQPNIDTTAKTVTFPSNFWIYYGKSRYAFPSAVVVNYITTATNQYILYNVKTNAFRAVAASAEASISENELLIMMIGVHTSGKIRSVFFTGTYSINGVIAGEKAPSKHYFAPEEIGGVYNTKGTGLKNFNTVESLHTKFNELATKYPEYLTGKILGKDASGTFDIYQFHAKPAQIDGDWLTKKLPKFVFTIGVHGGEKASTASFYYFMKDLCENWENDPILEYIRWNTEIVFIPIANPWSFENQGTHGGRHNVNGVDLNRNQSYLWTANGAKGDADYSGPSALSEAESQYIKKMIDDHKDAFFMSDYHTNGTSGSVYDQLMWHSQVSGDLGNENILIASKYLIEKMTRKLIKDHGLPSDQGMFGYISSTNIGGSIKLYAASLGVKANTIECWKMFPTEQTPYSENTLKGCTDYIGNWVLALLRQFKNVN